MGAGAAGEAVVGLSRRRRASRHEAADRVQSWTRQAHVPIADDTHPIVQSLRGGAYRVWVKLHGLVGRAPDRRTDPTSRRFLAALVCMAERSTGRSLRELVLAGLVRVHRRFGSPLSRDGDPLWAGPGHMANVYELIRPAEVPPELRARRTPRAAVDEAAPSEPRARRRWTAQQALQAELGAARMRFEGALPALRAAQARHAELVELAGRWREPKDLVPLARSLSDEVRSQAFDAAEALAVLRSALEPIGDALARARRWEALAVAPDGACGLELVELGPPDARELVLDWRRAWTLAQLGLLLAHQLDQHAQAATEAHQRLHDLQLLRPPALASPKAPTFAAGRWEPPANWRPSGPRTAAGWRHDRVRWWKAADAGDQATQAALVAEGFRPEWPDPSDRGPP